MDSYHIYGGSVVTPEAVIAGGTVTIEHGRIADISTRAPGRIGSRDIDAAGQWVLPGLVDSHSDAIEQEIRPHVRSLLPADFALRELERKLAGQGITCMYHALGLARLQESNTVRTPEVIRSIVAAVERAAAERPFIRHRIHLRFEITRGDLADFVCELLADGRIHQLSLTDHTPGQGQYRDMALYRTNIQQHTGVSDEEADRFLGEQLGRGKVDADRLQAMTELARRRGVPIASHDDDTIEKLDWVARLHATICEFPIELDVARTARARGMHVVMGAPNVLKGQSTNNNLSALEAIEADAVDMLCSDYYPPSLLQAVFLLHRSGCGMPRAVNMASRNPARALGIDGTVGSLEVGKAADIITVREWREFPAVTGVWADGESVFRMNYRRTEGA